MQLNIRKVFLMFCTPSISTLHSFNQFLDFIFTWERGGGRWKENSAASEGHHQDVIYCCRPGVGVRKPRGGGSYLGFPPDSQESQAVAHG